MEQEQRPLHRPVGKRDSLHEPASRGAEHACTLWVHDEGYSKKDVLINPAAFPDAPIVPGSILRIVAANNDSLVHDFQDSSGASRVNFEQSAAKDYGQPTAKPEAGARHKHSSTDETGYVFVVSEADLDTSGKYANLQVSVSGHIASLHGFKNRINVFVKHVRKDDFAASHVEISFRETHLTRDDMWRMAVAELSSRGIHEEHRLVFLGTIRATVKKIYARGRRVPSAIFTDTSKPIFRSESARFILYIQMSKEMWEFDPQNPGETMFDQVIGGFLPRLFAKWEKLNARHMVSIVLFTRMEYEQAPSHTSGQEHHSTGDAEQSLSHDFYRVVLSERSSMDSDLILYKLKKEFKTFLRDLSTDSWVTKRARQQETQDEMQESAANIIARPTSCIRGNILEAINLASMRFSRDTVDRDLARSGVSIVVISPGTGVFQVDKRSLKLATENLANVAIGIDLVCLSQLPLHTVPLFMYRKATPSQTPTSAAEGTRVKDVLPAVDEGPEHTTDEWSFAIPHWIDISFWTRGSLLGYLGNTLVPQENGKEFTPRCRMYELQMMGLMETEKTNISIPYLTDTQSYGSRAVSKPFNLIVDDFYASSPDSINNRPHGDTKGGTRAQDGRKRAGTGTKIRDMREESQWMDEYDKEVFNPKPKPRDESLRASQKWSRITSKTSKKADNPRMPDLPESPIRERQSPGSFNTSPQSSFLDQHMRHKESGQTDEMSTTPLRANAWSFGSSRTVPKASKSQQRHASLNLLGSQGKEFGKAMASTNSYLHHASSSSTVAKADKEDTNGPKNRVSDQVRASLSRHTSFASESTQKGTKPISIQRTTPDSTTEVEDLGTKAVEERATESRHNLKRTSSSRSGINNRSIESQHSSPRDVASSPPQDLLTPWLTITNASNPRKNHQSVARQFRRWQNVFPRPPRASRLKWKSLCSPAALPLTGDNRPSSEQLHGDFEESTYKLLPNEDEAHGDIHAARTKLLKQLVGFRLVRGFQVVPDIGISQIRAPPNSSAIFGHNYLTDESAAVFMIRGSAVHFLCAAGSEVQVTRYDLRYSARSPAENIEYRPFIQTEASEQYIPRPLTLKPFVEETNWNAIDNYLAGYDVSVTKALQFWRARFVLIPGEPPSSARRFTPVMAEDSDDEIYIEGVQRLTQHLFERSDLATSDSRGFQSALSRRRDPNPLGLEFQTRDASAVVAAGFETARLLEGEASVPPTQLFTGTEAYRTSTFDLQKLARDLQGERGIRIRDRRWYFRLHLNCFVGFDLTTWLLQNFKDVESREEAAELGNALMRKGLFNHVTKKHVFRDGNFFYSISSEYRIPRADSQSWFSRKGDGKQSVPSTPLSDKSKESDIVDRPETRAGLENQKPSDKQVLAAAVKPKPRVKLGDVLEYDIDHKKKSDRVEAIRVHYDKLYNPDSCYHFRIEWVNVTPKLVEDAVASWSAIVERFGLRLVELPISESAGVQDRHPFREPFVVKLSLPPPATQPPTFFDSVSLAPQVSSDPFIYHRLLLRRFNFVLDVEAASNFPADVEVAYSWGQPDYKYNQYIHQSGVVVAQVNEEGHFLLLANRLSAHWTSMTPQKDVLKQGRDKYDLPFERRPTSAMRSRPSAANIDRYSPFTSPHVRAVPDFNPSPMARTHDEKERAPPNAEQIKDQFEAFCHNVKALASFYEEVSAPMETPSGRMASSTIATLDSHIPSLEIPPSIAGVLTSGSGVSREPSVGPRPNTSAGSEE